jgi:exodeoxyribonuclease VII small subunit
MPYVCQLAYDLTGMSEVIHYIEHHYRQRMRVAMATNPEVEALSFEDSFAQMQAIVEQLEEGDIPLEAAIVTFERGMQLAQHCNTLLEQAQLRVQALEESTDGAIALSDIEIITE